MGRITVNFGDVENFEPLPEGEYPIEIDKVEVRRNKADDGDYLNWEMVIIDGDYENRRLWLITSLKEKALFRLQQILVELEVIEGDEEMDLEYDESVEITTSNGPELLNPDLQGLEAIAVVKNEMYDGKERNKVETLYGTAPKRDKRSSNSKSKKTASKPARRRIR